MVNPNMLHSRQPFFSSPRGWFIFWSETLALYRGDRKNVMTYQGIPRKQMYVFEQMLLCTSVQRRTLCFWALLNSFGQQLQYWNLCLCLIPSGNKHIIEIAKEVGEVQATYLSQSLLSRSAQKWCLKATFQQLAFWENGIFWWRACSLWKMLTSQDDLKILLSVKKWTFLFFP